MRVASLALGLALVCVTSSVGAVGASWDDAPLAAALLRAQREQKLVYIDLYATWCAPCQQMESEVYARDEVGRALASGYVALRRDGERGEGLELAQRYHVAGYPTMLVLDARGVELDRMVGSLGTTELLQQLRRIREGKGTVAELERALELAPTDSLRFEVGIRHAMRADARAVPELEAASKSDPENHAHRGAAALLALGKYYYLRGVRDFVHAELTLAELERRFPTSDEAAASPYQRALARQQSGRAEDARSVLDAWLAAAPMRADRYAAYAWFCFKESADLARGIEIARRGLQLAPSDDGMWDTLGELYVASHDRTEAQKAFAKAVALQPKREYYRSQLRKVGEAP